jgi:hypothetical protein
MVHITVYILSTDGGRSPSEGAGAIVFLCYSVCIKSDTHGTKMKAYEMMELPIFREYEDIATQGMPNSPCLSRRGFGSRLFLEIAADERQ